MELYDGRPADTAGREEKEIKVYDLLDSLGIRYRRTDHAPAATMEICDVIDAAPDCLICKNLMEEYLDIKPGAVSVMGLMNDHDNKVHLLVDKDVLAEEYVGCHPCVNTSSLKILTSDVFGVYLKAVHHDYIPVEL
ncbi:MAG: prolyl-tRNA synthetase associated domain-containing protein [Lachnospiraceae bacterium]|jgi:Ala-tRNA(Pro) deacylase|nr:prolyl-tRNA synthetase associated domain-containing protein [Lachnospiraceae bacterium]MCH4071037.1 prolyl-tRNA synthetase associated domain-containing protein [Lachnospiraceae bacterium]MCH4108108.1 prolyl-tRNA synthetase associated domain-containing protein [Lachnospiraceae bacterium]MCI1331921.1 prolyl-tRNA synthetase associated domain-containing protein [Lachnospiraceae bacterium]MCI1360671.1 prolyl-tRNA synthetase associated domain-containing protein [Lachnospiraceae bacterium]